jgi:serine phosphatase RsbU (regulator of sigma subunit)
VAWVVDTAVVVEPSGSPAASARHELRAWADSLGRFPASTLILFGDSIYAGTAVAVGANPHRVAIALVPAATLLAGVPSTVSGAPLAMWAGESRAGQADSARTGSRPERARGNRPIRVDVGDHPGGVTIATRNTSFTMGHRSSNAWTEITSGHVVLPVLNVGARGPRHEKALLRATIEPRAVLSGLFRIRGDEIGPLPLVLLGTLLVMLTFVAIFAIRMVGRMGRSITSAVGSLRVGAERLEAGDLAYRIPIAGDDELWDVADAFNVAAAGLQRAQALEKERTRLESELALARQIHARLLPASAPDVAGVEVAGLSRSAREVGGDYYDHIALEGGRVLLVIADVSGKGVPAALLMSAFRASLMSQDLERLAVAELAERLNAFMVRSVESGRFVTAFVGFLDGRTGRLEYVNAGHNPPLVARTDGRHERLETGGLIFGILAGSRYECGEARLDPGDRLVLYTDGVTEGANVTGEQWGEERLVELLVADGHPSCRALVERIADTVRAFEGDAGPADDVTVLAVRRLA